MDELPPIRKRRGRSLPHWTREGFPNYVTMRLGDALPISLVEEYKTEIARRIEALERRLGRRTLEEERAEIRRVCSGRVERYLDAGHGECVLRDPRAAKAFMASLQLHVGERYALDAWCVMPNHAHIILTPAPGWTLEKITYDLKHGSAVFVNRAVGRRGKLWQSESFDHLPRSEDSLARFRRYVLENPAKAGLVDWPFVGLG